MLTHKTYINKTVNINETMNYIHELLSLDFFFRKKQIGRKDLGESKLARVLNTLDLTALGIGSTLGAG